MNTEAAVTAKVELTGAETCGEAPVKSAFISSSAIIKLRGSKSGSKPSGPKVSILSATEEVLKSVPSSIDANLITKKAKEENINADVFGPLAFDNSISKKSAAIKKIKNTVAGNADILLVPNVESGNALVKMMVYFMGACAAGVVIGGKVPVVITSRADESEARLASIAAAVIAFNI